MLGISTTQLAHHVAQKLTRTTLPRRASVETVSPVSVAKPTCGAGTGRSVTYAAQTAIATAATTAIILAFMRTILAALLAISTSAALGQLEGISRADATAALKA